MSRPPTTASPCWRLTDPQMGCTCMRAEDGDDAQHSDQDKLEVAGHRPRVARVRSCRASRRPPNEDRAAAYAVDVGRRAGRRRLPLKPYRDGGQERRGSEVQQGSLPVERGVEHWTKRMDGPNCLARKLMGKTIGHQTAGGPAAVARAAGGSQGSQSRASARGHRRPVARDRQGRAGTRGPQVPEESRV